MKQRKVYLEGFVKYNPVMFANPHIGTPCVVVHATHIGILARAVSKANFNFKDGVCHVSIFRNNKGEYAIVEDEDSAIFMRNGKVKGRQARMNCKDLAESMIEQGFELNKRYKAIIPEQGVLIITTEQVRQ